MDATEKLLEILADVQKSVKELERKVEVNGSSTRTDFRLLVGRMEELAARVDVVERSVRYHESGIRQASETDAHQQGQVAAIIVAVEETRKLAKKAHEKSEDVERELQDVMAETKAQTPVLAKVDDQTKTLSVPTKVAALFNFLIGLLYLLSEIAKALGRH